MWVMAIASLMFGLSRGIDRFRPTAVMNDRYPPVRPTTVREYVDQEGLGP